MVSIPETFPGLQKRWFLRKPPVPARCLLLASVLLPMALFGSPSSGAAQASVGGQLAWNPDLLNDPTWGVGARGILPLPLGDLALLGTVDSFMPDCKNLECDLLDAGLSLLWLPSVGMESQVYLGGGVAVQRSEGTWRLGNHRELGISLRAGLILGGRAFLRFRPFSEARYQLMGGDFPNQLVISGGILLVLRRSA